MLRSIRLYWRLEMSRHLSNIGQNAHGFQGKEGSAACRGFVVK
jgi:hypothetical protein